jgi:hypothetical protein
MREYEMNCWLVGAGQCCQGPGHHHLGQLTAGQQAKSPLNPATSTLN